MRHHARAAFGLLLLMATIGAAWVKASEGPGAASVAAPPLLGVGVIEAPGLPLEGPGIAYAITLPDGTSDVATMHADGSNRFVVVDHPANDTEPVWSPGGQVITFVSDRSGTADIYLVDPDGSNLQQVTFGESAAHPRWNPRGVSIAYIGRGGSLRVADPGAGAITPLPPVGVSGFDWSPDGTRIAYHTGPRRSYPTSAHGIHVVDEDGANDFLLAHVPPAHFPERLAVSSPLWEPDARFIRYALLTGFGDGGIETSRQQRVSVQGFVPPSPWVGRVPLAMSPDGSRTVAGSPTLDPSFPPQLYIMDADGGSLRLGGTSLDTIMFSRFAWSPDGSHVVYDDQGRILVVDADAGSVAEIGPPRAAHPSWRPPPSLPPRPLPSIVVEEPAVGAILPADSTHVDIRVQSKHYDGPWQWSLNRPFPAQGMGGGVHVARGASARVEGLRAGAWHTVYVAPVDADGTLIEPVFRMFRRFRLAPPGPSPSLSDTLIAFINSVDGEIRVAPPTGGTRQVTDDGGQKRGICWSPDGLRIAYSSNAGGTFDIWTTGRDGAPEQVTDYRGDETYPSWSPDGTAIAYGSRVGDVRRVYTVDLATSTAVALTSEGAIAAAPSWSPDGSRMAVSLSDWSRNNWNDLGILTLNTGELLAFPGVGARQAQWSPIGGPLLVQRDVDTHPYGDPVFVLHTVDPDGEHALPLPTHIRANGHSWSPDGSMIAFQGPGRGISLALADGTDIRPLPKASPNAYSPAWSPVPSPGGIAEDVEEEAEEDVAQEGGTDDHEPEEPPPPATRALPNYPNPFLTRTNLPYELHEAADVSIRIFAMDGSPVRAIRVGQREPGRYIERWDGRNAAGEPVSSGVYIWRLRVGNRHTGRRLIVGRR